jgi:hypothetical protein
MNKAFEQFTEFFDKQEWTYCAHGEKPVIKTEVTGENGRWPCLAVAEEEGENIAFLSYFPSRAPANQRVASAELLTRINLDLKHGCFELDFESGDIRFRTSLSLTPDEVTPAMLERLVFMNLFTVDHYYGAIMKVLHAGLSPQEALKKPEEKPVTEPRFEFN